MKNKIHLYLLIFLAIFLSSSCGKERELVKIEKGTIDLTEWNFEKDGVFPLTGESEFYWNQLILPENFGNNTNLTPQYVNIPGNWNSGDIDGNEIENHGYATYHFLIKTKYNKELSFKILGASTAYKLWIDGKLVGTVGTVGTTKEESKPMYRPNIYSIVPNINLKDGEIRTIEVVMQISNFHHTNSGIWENIEIGDFESTQRTKTRHDLFNSLILGILLIMGIYHFALYYLRRDDYSTLFFGILTIFMVFRGFVTGDRLILELFTNINFFLLIKIEYLSVYTNMVFIGYFFYHLFKKDVSKKVINIFAIISALASLTIIFSPVNIFTSLRDVYNLIVLGAGIYVTFFALIKAMKNKRQGAVLAFIGMFGFFGTGVLDIVTTVAMLPIPLLAPYGLVFYILSQSFIISQRFSISFKKNIELTNTLDYQNKNLEQIVKERTAEILQQSEEILAQKEELLAINDELYAMNSELEKLSIVAQQTDNAVIITDSKGNLEWINEGFSKMYEYTLEEFKLINPNIFKASTNENVEKLIQQCLETKTSIVYESTGHTKGGKQLWIHSNLVPILDNSGDVKKFTIVETDISKLKEAESEILKNRDLLFVKNEHINASINYAVTIQKAVLPIKETIDKYFDNFVIFKPKDIVSGDFYLFNKVIINEIEIFFVAAIDCTGHGVPGAFMSLIGSRLLNEIINVQMTYSPKDILTELNKGIIKSLRQRVNNNRDGMDVCLCKIQKSENETTKLSYSGAKRDLYIYKNNSGELERARGQRKSIGGVYSKINKLEFFNNDLLLSKNDIIYLSTDGFIDQNNEARKRFGSKKFIEIILNNAKLPLEQQNQSLSLELKKWQGTEPQRDDITVIGLRMN